MEKRDESLEELDTGQPCSPYRWAWSPRCDLAVLAIIIVIAIALRGSGLLHGIGLHPDERHMVMVTSDLKDHGFNPKSFAYGSFSFYAAWGFAHILSPPWEILAPSLEWLTGPVPHSLVGYDGLFIAGRLFCILMGTAAVPLTYLLALLLYRHSGIGLVAAALLACNVFHIQLSRFFTSDITLTTLSLLAVVALVLAYRRATLVPFLIFGFCAGLATATKISSAFLAIPLALSVILITLGSHADSLRAIKQLGWATAITLVVAIVFLAGWHFTVPTAGVELFGSQVPKEALLIPLLVPFAGTLSVALWRLSKPLAYASLALTIGAITFICAEPFAVLDYTTFTHHLQEQTSMVRGYWRPPYTIQYAKTVPYFYHLKQMLWYTMGWPVFLVAACGFFVAAIRTTVDLIRRAATSHSSLPIAPAEILPLTFVIVFFLTTAGFQVKFPRYLLPLYPFLLLFGASLFRGAFVRSDKRAGG